MRLDGSDIPQHAGPFEVDAGGSGFVLQLEGIKPRELELQLALVTGEADGDG